MHRQGREKRQEILRQTDRHEGGIGRYRGGEIIQPGNQKTEKEMIHRQEREKEDTNGLK